MKPIILGAIGLFVGLGGGTGVTVLKHKKLQAAVTEAGIDSTGHVSSAVAHDSTKSAGPASDTVAAHAAPPVPAADSAAHPADAVAGVSHDDAIPSAALAPSKTAEAVHADDKPHASAPAPASTVPPLPKVMTAAAIRPAGAAATKPDAAQRAAGFKQLARIFGSMKAVDAVKVMALMTDEEVEGVLRALGPKQAADMLGEFPKERAAALSRRLLVPTVKV